MGRTGTSKEAECRQSPLSRLHASTVKSSSCQGKAETGAPFPFSTVWEIFGRRDPGTQQAHFNKAISSSHTSL